MIAQSGHRCHISAGRAFLSIATGGDMTALTNASLFALFSIVITATPMVAGFAFALRPTAARLGQVRALTLVGVFVTLAVMLSGSVNVLIYLARQSPTLPDPRAELRSEERRVGKEG